MDRRVFLSAVAGGAVLALAGCTGGPQWDFPTASPGVGKRPTSTPQVTPGSITPVPSFDPAPLQGPPQLAKVSLPAGAITALPGHGALLAWTVDDGIDADVVLKYI